VRRLRAHPLTQSLAPTFEALLSAWTLLHQKELELADKVDDTVIEASAIDGELNAFAHRTSHAVLELTSKNRNHPLYTHFFGGKPLHVFTRPILSWQLDAMRQWNPSLAQSGHASLAALGGDLPALIEKADEVVAARATAEQAVDAAAQAHGAAGAVRGWVLQARQAAGRGAGSRDNRERD
jgi:hypothetical protein